MKKLLNKTIKTFAFYSLIVLAASVPAYYYLVDGIWQKELDEHNRIIADRVENELSRLLVSETEFVQIITVWNKIHPGTDIKEFAGSPAQADSVYTVLRENVYTVHTDVNRFRGLSRIIQVHKKLYRLNVETNIEESEETVLAIALITFIFFAILVIGFLVLNRRLSFHLWKPFRNTLAKLKSFNLNSGSVIAFEKTDTLEFEELNIALTKLMEQNISAYKAQKEFTENASHELQTPLAIIKNKLDLFLQAESLSDRQYELIEEINRALTRISRINKNLLLLAKIENHQFDNTETVNIHSLVSQCVEELKEYAGSTNISIQQSTESDIIIAGNKALAEVLVNNLLVNAIRYNRENGLISIFLKELVMIISNSGNEALDGSNIFKRFAGASAEGSGSGLGLALVKEICNSHGWAIHYEFTGNCHHFIVSF